MTNAIINLAFAWAIADVEAGPKNNPLNFTRAAWADTMKWRRERKQSTWPLSFRAKRDYALAACISFNELNWHWLTEHQRIAMPIRDVEFCRITLYAIYWRGKTRYLSWAKIPDDVYERASNVAGKAAGYDANFSPHGSRGGGTASPSVQPPSPPGCLRD